jgi:DeoR/GlpR family transcriptional regulator of sugar metabolism
VLRPDLCILGVCGVDVNAGLTAFEYEDAAFKRLVARNSASVLAAVTNDKLGTSAPHTVIAAPECATLIVEHDADRNAADLYSGQGIHVVYAEGTRP